MYYVTLFSESVTALMIDFIVLCLCRNRADDCLQCFWPDGQSLVWSFCM